MSCRDTSSEEFDRMIPVKPPIENIIMNPKAHKRGVSFFIYALDSVAIQLNILIPVGIAMIIVAAEK